MRTTLISSAKSAAAVLLVVSTLIPAIHTGQAAATVSGANWQAGNIIEDPVFYNSNDMSVQQVQDFLNAQVPTCDTNGTLPATEFGRSDLTHAQYAQAHGWAAPPYVCLKDYQENPTTHANNLSVGGSISGGINAAQIIINAAQTYGVSVRALLATLQKESSGPLVTDTWPLPSQYKNPMGYGCPDTAPCDPNFAGFYNQVTNAARQFSLYKANPNNYRYKPLQNNTILYSPNGACGSSTVYVQNYATAGLYNYTPYQPNQAALNNMYGSGDSCSSYGNRNFWRIFNDWFGSTKSSAADCNSKVANVVCVWSMVESDGSQFLTSSRSEMESALTNFGWKYDGVAFYASQVAQTGTVPVHRLRQNSEYFYTTDQSEYNSMIASGTWTDEGIPFYVYPSTASASASHQVYKLYNSVNDHYYWTDNSNQETLLLSSGYVLQSNPFNSFSPLVNLPLPAVGRDNIYEVAENGGYFYTTNLTELESVINAGRVYDGVLTTANAANTGTAVYRLQRNGIYLYTVSTSERDAAVSQYGYAYEGIGFYVDDSSAEVYRLDNTQNNTYLYTNSIDTVMSVANTNGWVYEGDLADKDIDPSPVYRFLNLLNNRHFYTIDINEAARIANKGWKYETVAFYANKSSGLPVYRLLLYDKHFYTTDVNEKNIAVSKYGYVYEGVAFYVSPTATGNPVYRLQGGPDEYFYTASSAERDRAVSVYKYSYEGLGFYLPN